MRVACEKYNTAVMEENDVLLFIETALENGADVQEAIDDMRMIDTLMYAAILDRSVGRLNKKTASGHWRKGSDLYTTLERVVEGRATAKF